MVLQTAGKRYGYLPRLARLQVFHKLLWYWIYGKQQFADGGGGAGGGIVASTVHCKSSLKLENEVRFVVYDETVSESMGEEY